jgi:ABC-2 type transport system permease protein
VSGRIRGFVVIPSYFSEFRRRGTEASTSSVQAVGAGIEANTLTSFSQFNKNGSIAPIQAIGDGSEPNTAQFFQNYVKGAVQGWLQIEKFSDALDGLQRISMQQRVWYNEQLESRNYLIPGSIAIIMTLIGTLLTALVVSREWERGTMEALMSTPVGIQELLIGKLIPYFILGIASMTICVVVATLFYEVPFRGSFWVLALVSSIFLLAALALGLLISTIAKNQFVAAQVSMVTAFLPAFMLSGFIFEITSMPIPIQFITYILPARYFVSALQTLFLVGNIWPLLITDMICMAVIALLLYVVISFKTVKRLD